jgi:predicted alpha/beta-fold hydrolase
VRLDESFHAPAWIRGAHAQTIGGRLLRKTGGVGFRKERIETPDGDFVDLEYAAVEGHALAPDAPIVLKLHGLEGSAHSGYSVELARALARRGVRSVGLNFRSCGGEMNRTARFYHSGETEDLALVLAHLHRTFPAKRLGALGFSLGGNVLLKYLGEQGASAGGQLAAAVAVSVPYDLGACADRMNRGGARIYASFFLRSLRAKVRAKEAQLAGLCQVERGLKAKRVRDFDEALTAPLHGFAGAEDYYRRSSAGQFLSRISIPTLLIHSLDDPIAVAESIPHGTIEGNPHLTTALTATGGHVGFVEGPGPWSPSFWAEQRGAEFLATVLNGPAAESFSSKAPASSAAVPPPPRPA